MKITNAPIDVLKSILTKLTDENFCCDQNETWIDITEYWNFVKQLEKEIKTREENSLKLDNKERYFKYKLFNTYNILKLFTYNNKSTAEQYSYFIDNKALTYTDKLNCNDIPTLITKDDDNRICLTFGDDEGGSCYPIEISKNEYESIAKLPLSDWTKLDEYDRHNWFVDLF